MKPQAELNVHLKATCLICDVISENYQLSVIATFHNALKLAQRTQRITRIIVCVTTELNKNHFNNHIHEYQEACMHASSMDNGCAVANN